MKTFLKYLLGLLLLILLLAGGALLFLETATGKRFIETQAAKWLNDTASGAGVQLDGLSGTIPSDMRLAHITLSDRQGVYAEARDVHLAWHPTWLLRRHIAIEALEAGSVVLHRLPVIASSGTPAAKSGGIPTVPQVTLEKLSVREWRVEPPVTGTLHILSLKGGGAHGAFQLKLATLAGPDTTLALDVALGRETLNGHFLFHEAPGGLTGGLLKLPAGSSLASSADIQMDARKIVTLTNGVLDAAGIHLTLGGTYDLNSRTVHGTLDATDADLAPFAPLAGSPLAGDAQLHLAFDGQLAAMHVKLRAETKSLNVQTTHVEDGHVTTDVTLDVSSHAGNGTAEAAMQVNGVALAAQLHGKVAKTKLTLDLFSARYGIYHITGPLQGDWKKKFVKAALELDPIPLAELSRSTVADGTVAAKATLEGTQEMLAVDTQAIIKAKAGDATLRFIGSIHSASAAAEGALTGKILRQNHNLTFGADVKADKQVASLNNIRVDTDGLAAKGWARWDWVAALADADLTLDAPDLRPVAEMLGQKMTGHANLTLALRPEDTHQSLHAEGRLGAIDWNDTRLDEARFSGAVIDLKTLKGLEASVTANNLAHGATNIERLDVKAHGDGQRMVAATMSFKGSISKHPLQLALEGSGGREKPDEPTLRVLLNHLDGLFENQKIALKMPVTLFYAPHEMKVTPLALTLGNNSLEAAGRIHDGAVNAQLGLSLPALETLPILHLPEGKATAKLALTGTGAVPVLALDGDMSVRNDEYPLTVHMNGGWKTRALTLHAALTAPKTKISGDVAIASSISLMPFAMDLSPKAPIGGTVKIDTGLEGLNGYLRAGNERASGHLSGGGALTGTLGHPHFGGKLALSGGQFDVQNSSLCMHHMAADLDGGADGFVITNLHATSDNGTMDGSLKMGLTGEKLLKASLNFNRYHLFCGGLANGDLSGGVAANGEGGKSRVTGDVKLSQLNVQLPDAAGKQASIPEVKTVRVMRKQKGAKVTSAGLPAEEIMLDLTIDAPNQLFVRGRGLDAEFGGKIGIHGKASAPVIAGQFESVRGKFDFLDRELKITSGTIQFEGPIPPSPFLNIQAESVVKDTTVDVALTGPAAAPAFVFTANPPRPQDEILALLLFGRDLSSLSPFQVVQLAQSTAELTGHGGGPGVLGKVRSFLGVDTLDVGTDTNNDVTVGTGKYITDKVYVGVTQGAKPDSRAVNTEIELHPNVTANTAISAQGYQSLGLQWKHDY